jgi:ABC-type lipoprotein export system ATPase subunit
MEIEEHLNIIFKKYNLYTLYYKYVIVSIVSTLVREGFHWLLLYYTALVKENEENMRKYTTILLIFYFLNIPLDRYYNSIKSELCIEINKANYRYFNERVFNLSKSEILDFNLIDYYQTLFKLMVNTEDYIVNLKNKYDIPIRCLTIIIVALSKQTNIIFYTLPIIFLLIMSIYKKKLVVEVDLLEKSIESNNIIRDYISNCKNLLINDNINEDYLEKIMNNFMGYHTDVKVLNNNVLLKINLIVYIFIILIIKSQYHKLNPAYFLQFFIIIYDIEFFTEKINTYYVGEVNYNGINKRLKYLYNFKPEDKNRILNIPFDKIVISNLNNKLPYLQLDKPIIINNKDHILVDGDSGSGKTSFLYVLKTIIKPNILKIEPLIETISNTTYLTLTGQQQLVNGDLYDIITDYNKNYDATIIKKIIKQAKFNIEENVFINISSLSAGERSRLLICRILYNNIIGNYKIFLLDEIDMNLDKETAIEIYNNITSILKDKIILYITHNNYIKPFFNKVINITNGIITYNKQ